MQYQKIPADMQQIQSAALLQSLHQQTESLLQHAVAEWQMIPPGQFSTPPAPDSWSAAQCLAHLNGYGDYYLPWLKKAVGYPKRSADFRSGWLGNYFAKLMEPGQSGTPAKKMKAFKQHIPPVQVDSSAEIAIFIEQQETLLQLLEAASNADLNKRIVPVSIMQALRLKTGDVFRFVIAHNQRHAVQADRALARVGVSAARSRQQASLY